MDQNERKSAPMMDIVERWHKLFAGFDVSKYYDARSGITFVPKSN